MLNLLSKVWCSCYRRNKNNNTSNNTSSSNLPHVLLLSHLPTEILSKIILELLNERALMKSISGTPQRGLLSIYKPLSELSTNRMIPLIQVNKFFYQLVWTVTLNHSYWNQHLFKYEGYMRCLALFRTKPFVFTENMLQSKGIEPVNQFYLLGSLSQNQLRFVRHVVLERMPFLLSSVGRGLHRSFTIPKLQYLTTINIYATFVAVLANNYELVERKSWMSWIERYVRLNNSSIEPPPFTNCFLKQTNSLKEHSEILRLHYELLICQTIVNMIASLDHSVRCTITHSNNICMELKCLIWTFAKQNMISQVNSLVLCTSEDISCKECIEMLGLLKPEYLTVYYRCPAFISNELATILIEHNPNLRRVQIDNVDLQQLDFPANLEVLKTTSNPIFSKLNLPLGQKFTFLIELGLEFQSQVDKKCIQRKLLHLPTLQTLRVSGVLLPNIELISCILESNPTVTSLSIYYEGYYEHLETLYHSLRNVKLLNISYRSRLEYPHTLDFNLASILNVILKNTSSLAILLIHKRNRTGNLSFKNLAAKLCVEYEKSTKHLRYIYIYNSTTTYKRLDAPDLIPIFFDNKKDEICEMSPYNPGVKKLYKIDGAILGDKIDAGRCRLELDVCGIRKFFQKKMS